ncbi:hypothetical protein D3C86_1465850 [compost metagenome]
MFVSPGRGQGVARAQHRRQLAQRQVLLVGVGQGVRAFKFDANGKVVAAFALAKARHPGVPGALVGGHELNDAPIAANKEVGRYAQAAQAFQPGVRSVVECVQEQPGDFGAAKLARRQADIVQHQQRDLRAIGTRVVVGRGQQGYTRGRRQPAMSIQKQSHKREHAW